MNYNHSLISIIIPIFNSGKYLCKCLDSILEQSYPDFEVILVDDGSTDSSGNICDDYAKKDSRFTVIHKVNNGVSSARNTGLEMAKGDWVYFVDSDDELYPNALETLFHFTNNKIDMVMAGYSVIQQDGFVQIASSDEINKTLTKDEAVRQMYKPEYYNYLGYLWIKLFRKSLILKHNLMMNEDIYFNEDRLFSIEYMCKLENKVFFTTTPVYKYYLRNDSAMASIGKSFNPKFITDFDAFVLMKNAILGSGGTKENIVLSQIAIIDSWLRIKRMLRNNNIKDDSLKQYLSNKIKRNVALYPFFRYGLRALWNKLRMYFKSRNYAEP